MLVRHHPEHSSGLHVTTRHVAIVLSYGHGHVLGPDPVKVLYGQGACLVTRVVLFYVIKSVWQAFFYFILPVFLGPEPVRRTDQTK